MEFDKIVHQSTRLQILSYLYPREKGTFNDLKEDLELTEGNLASHLKKLEKAGYVEVEKKFVDRKPQTTYIITGKGKKALEDHVQKLEDLIEMTEG
ncbi:MAG: transcriptional regulator [Candidatus Saliniplasma sp.]